MSLETNVESTESVAVIGAGYVGLVSGVCFAALGYQVGIVEIDAAKVASLRQGKSTIFEPGLTELLSEGLESGRLRFYGSTQELFAASRPDVVFVAVGTPERPDGSCNMDYVFQAVRDVATTANKNVVLVLKSTVPVGTAEKVKNLLAQIKPTSEVAVVNNPEFLKEGSAIADFMRPERVVLGGTEGWALAKVKALYESFLHNGHPLFVTNHETAELGKLAANLMLASRISVVNQIARLAAASGADIKLVESVLRSDSRIGSKYLYAGMGYGGSCFPKDVKSFIQQCEERGVDASVAKSIASFNESQKKVFVPDLLKRFPDASKTTIAVWGLAFKPETDDIRESPALALIEALLVKGYSLRLYDPKAAQNVKSWCQAQKIDAKRVVFAASAEECVTGAQALVLATEWQEFQRFSPLRLKKVFPGRVIYDGKNVLKAKMLREAGFEYVSVGRA